MSAVVRFESPGVASIVTEEQPPLGADEVRLGTVYSGISAGTELTAYRGTNPYLNKRWDAERRLFVEGSTSIAYPVDGWGYEEVGRVVELGSEVDGVAVGDLIWGTWGHRASTVKPASYARDRVLDPSADPRIGIFSQIGAIALNVVLDADIHIGETVAVFGLGVPGQIVAQLARLNGARVIAVDAIGARLELARKLGAAETIDAGDGGVAERIRELTGGMGADVSLEVSGAYPALHEAIRSTAYSSRVVAAGFFQGAGNGLFLGEELHHNRIQIVCSQISGTSPSLRHRWDTHRLQRTAIELAVSGRLDVISLISHTVPAAEAAAAFELLDHTPREAMQVVLSFEETRPEVAAR